MIQNKKEENGIGFGLVSIILIAVSIVLILPDYSILPFCLMSSDAKEHIRDNL